jgi:hypothetical protein
MKLSAVWLVPLGIGVLGAGALGLVAARLRRDVAELQKSLRPLRVSRKTGEAGPRAR